MLDFHDHIPSCDQGVDLGKVTKAMQSQVKNIITNVTAMWMYVKLEANNELGQFANLPQGHKYHYTVILVLILSLYP